MQPLWCHLQSHHFKGTKAPQCHQHKEQTHPLTSSFVLLSLNGNSHTESPYMVKGELHSVLYNQVFLGSCPLALTVCTTVTMTSFLYSSSLLLTWKTALVCEDVCTYMCLLCVCVSVCEWVSFYVIVYTHLSAQRIPWLQCCQFSKSSHWKCSQVGYDVMRQGDNTTTTLVHG